MKLRNALATLAVVFTPAIATTTAQSHFYAGCKKNKCKQRAIAPFNDHLNRIARCESGGDWYNDSQFDGGLQFDSGTWSQTGSKFATADLAGVLEQKYRAVIWASKIGFAWHTTAGWPVCG